MKMCEARTTLDSQPARKAASVIHHLRLVSGSSPLVIDFGQALTRAHWGVTASSTKVRAGANVSGREKLVRCMRSRHAVTARW